MQLVFLTTDVLFLGLIAMAISYGVYAHRHEHLNAPWREVRRNRMGMSAAVVLATFLTIGILDSIHFHPKLEQAEAANGKTQYSTEVLSVFDALATPMRTQVEKTYSAPFAIFAFAKETIELDGGKTTRDYPRLLYGGAHLESLSERSGDLIQKSFWGVGLGVGLWVVVVAALALLVSVASKTALPATVRNMLSAEGDTPWRIILLTMAVVAVFIGLIASISPY